MKSPVVLIALGLAVAFTLLLIGGHDQIFHVRSTSSSNSQPAEMQSSRPTSTPTNMGQIGTLGTSMSARPFPPAEFSRLYLKLTESPDPVANQLFTECFRLMDQGNYREAGSKLVAFMEGKAFSDHKRTMPPAWWLLAWCILNEGGNKNSLDAAERFWICANLPGIGGHEELAKAAVFNRAVIYADLLNTTEGEKRKYTENAVESLNLFLERWPNDPRSSEVRNMLDSLNGAHP
jgi:hypothetical protein